VNNQNNGEDMFCPGEGEHAATQMLKKNTQTTEGKKRGGEGISPRKPFGIFRYRPRILNGGEGKKDMKVATFQRRGGGREVQKSIKHKPLTGKKRRGRRRVHRSHGRKEETKKGSVGKKDKKEMKNQRIRENTSLRLQEEST